MRTADGAPILGDGNVAIAEPQGLTALRSLLQFDDYQRGPRLWGVVVRAIRRIEDTRWKSGKETPHAGP